MADGRDAGRDAAPDDLSSLTGARSMYVRGQRSVSSFSGDCALRRSRPRMTNVCSRCPSPYTSHQSPLPAQVHAAAIYLVVERRSSEAGESLLYVTTAAKVSADADADPSGPWSTALDAGRGLLVVSEQTETTVVPAPEGQYPLPTEYGLGHSSDEVSFADPRDRVRLRVGENDPPGISRPSGPGCRTRPPSTSFGSTTSTERRDARPTPSARRTSGDGLSDRELSWWTESRVIFRSKRPPADATVSVEVSDSDCSRAPRRRRAPAPVRARGDRGAHLNDHVLKSAWPGWWTGSCRPSPRAVLSVLIQGPPGARAEGAGSYQRPSRTAC